MIDRFNHNMQALFARIFAPPRGIQHTTSRKSANSGVICKTTASLYNDEKYMEVNKHIRHRVGASTCQRLKLPEFNGKQ